MKTTEDMRKYAAKKGISDEAPLKQGMKEKGREFAEKRHEIYAKT